MITGFNTDIEHGGVTYHVQTEDKGLDSPLILSLVYVGGAILASKRTPYRDLIETGFEEKTLVERLQRQHKLICAAIRAGRIEELKQMGERDPASKPSSAKKENADYSPKQEAAAVEAAVVNPAPTSSLLELLTDAHVPIVPEGIEFRAQVDSVPSTEVYRPEPRELHQPVEAEEMFSPALDGDDDELYLNLLDDEGEFRAGQLATIKIYVGRGKFGRVSVPGVEVIVKVLGTTFRPLIVSTQTDDDGLAVVRALLPQFTSGRAAILIRATDANGDVAELRRIIHQ